VFGERGSLQWHQEEPELLLAADAEGNRRLIDRISTDSTVTTESRYQRFKAGHPAGFIEAFANYYFDVAEAIRSGAVGPSILPFAVVEEGLRVCEAIHRSSSSGTTISLG
jgi:predicted dehydrogenase